MAGNKFLQFRKFRAVRHPHREIYPVLQIFQQFYGVRDSYFVEGGNIDPEVHKQSSKSFSKSGFVTPLNEHPLADLEAVDFLEEVYTEVISVETHIRK